MKDPILMALCNMWYLLSILKNYIYCNHHSGSNGPRSITWIISICPIDALVLLVVREMAKIWKQMNLVS